MDTKPGNTKKPGGGETKGVEPRGDIGGQLDGPAGLVDAPSPAATVKRKG
jgi:hypothetical protein